MPAALYEAMNARAMKMSTCAGGYVPTSRKGEGILKHANIVLKALTEERYVDFVPYEVPRKTK